jgi:oxygen-dependent protoporphyrinogen oxidase
MRRVAIIGGGISGLTAAYELELARKRGAEIDWHLYEASDRLGGIVETTRLGTPEGEYILEGGPDGWVSEKPWARELAVELGLEDELIDSNDATRKTYILREGELVAIPDGMRLMVPEDLGALDGSPLFSASARQAYTRELERGDELKGMAPEQDESVANFVLRHFGEEVLTTLAAPLLSGVFGGDVRKLSVRAVMPQFVAMEREHGSLIAALRAKAAERGGRSPHPVFTSLRHGVASLTQALTGKLSDERVHLGKTAYDLALDVEKWYVDLMHPEKRTFLRRLTTVIPYWDHLVLALPMDVVRHLLNELDPDGTALSRSNSSFLSLAPKDASSAVLVNLVWSPEVAQAFTLPEGFGFLVADQTLSSRPEPERSAGVVERPAARDAGAAIENQLLACTFVDQKFPHRAPDGARVLRAFFGGADADGLAAHTDEAIATEALTQLRAILGAIPAPSRTVVRRWPRSLPQYEVGHLDRMERLDQLVAGVPGLHLLGNSYRGVGLPDLIREARATARKIVAKIVPGDKPLKSITKYLHPASFRCI